MRFILILFLIVIPLVGYAERQAVRERIVLTYPAVKSIDENAIIFISDELFYKSNNQRRDKITIYLFKINSSRMDSFAKQLFNHKFYFGSKW